ncbi:MAG: hypothetical protein WBW03_29150 [Silvibacterium sp.]
MNRFKNPLWSLLLLGRFSRQHSVPRISRNRRHLKGVIYARTQSSSLYFSTARAPGLRAWGKTQVVLSIGQQPICSYGYYDYSPYACAPVGFYGPGYFYNGIFLGMGPWSGWGYGHGWGGHRFTNSGGGRYTGGGGYAANHGNYGSAGVVHANNNGTYHPQPSGRDYHAAPAHANAPHGEPHAQPAHASVPHIIVLGYLAYHVAYLAIQ